MNEGFSISVIIPVFNDGNRVHDAISSALACKDDIEEIILVNDGSTDTETRDILQQWKDCDLITLLEKENGGVGSARNLGVRNCKSTFYYPLDADNKLHSDIFSKMKKAWVLNPNTDVIYTDRRAFGDAHHRIRSTHFDLNKLLVGNFIDNGALVRKSCWEKSKGYNTQLQNYEDWEFWIQLAELNCSFTYLPEDLLFYRVHGQSKSNRMENAVRRSEVVEQIVQQHGELYKKHVVGIMGAVHRILSSTEEEYVKRLAELEISGPGLYERLAELEQLLNDLRTKEGGFLKRIRRLFRALS